MAFFIFNDVQYCINIYRDATFVDKRGKINKERGGERNKENAAEPNSSIIDLSDQ